MEKYFVVLGFIFFDIVTGIIKALSNEGLNSTVLRKGLFNKLSEILSAAGAGLAEYGLQYIDIGITIPLAASVCAYICAMELVSIIENICVINPIMGKFFKPFLNKLNGDEKKEVVEKAYWMGEGDGYADGEMVYDIWSCSNCGYTVDECDNEQPHYNYCPNCGKYMKGDNNGKKMGD